jgi:hypothetical protein
MSALTFDQEITYSKPANLSIETTLPSKEQIEQLKAQLEEEDLTAKRLTTGIIYFMPFLIIFLFIAWLAWD